LAARRAKALSIGLLTGVDGETELERSGALRLWRKAQSAATNPAAVLSGTHINVDSARLRRRRNAAR
jgi:hypothetical protein